MKIKINGKEQSLLQTRQGLFRFSIGRLKETIKNLKAQNIRLKIKDNAQREDWEQEKHAYIIEPSNRDAGFFSNFHCVVGNLIKISNKPLKPVVDLRGSAFKSVRPDERFNLWEHFFVQPGGITLEAALASQNKIHANGSFPNEYWDPGFSFLATENNPKLNLICDIVNRHIKFSEPFGRFLETGVYRMFSPSDRVLGVAYRGTDYKNRLIALGHYRQPSVLDLISSTRRVFEKGEYDAVFLTSDEDDAVSEFKKVFGSKLITMERKRFFGIESMPRKLEIMGQAGIETTGNYISEIIGLSRCTSLVGGINNGTIAAIEFNNLRYQEVDLNYLGIIK